MIKLPFIRATKCTDSASFFIKHIYIQKHSLQDIYPNLKVALREYVLIMLVTAASTMDQKHLSNLAILSIEHEIASTIHFN